MDDYLESDLLSPREKAAILWAEHITLNTAKTRDDVYDAVRKEFSEEEIIELTLMSGFFNLFNRLTDSLHVPVEAQDEVDKIKKSVDLDPDKVKTYLQTTLDTWPETFPEPKPD